MSPSPAWAPALIHLWVFSSCFWIHLKRLYPTQVHVTTIQPKSPRWQEGFLCRFLEVFLSFFIKILFIFIFKNILFIYFFREKGREGERERETLMCACPSRAPNWRPGPQLRHVPWLGIERVTLWFIGPCSIHWATHQPGQLFIYF